MSETESYPNAEFFRISEWIPNVPKCGLNKRHDNREVTFILIRLTRTQTLSSDKCATGSTHRTCG